MNANLYSQLRDRFEPSASEIFLDPPGEHSISYGEADELSARFAAALSNHDVKTGDRVVVQVLKSVDAVLLYLACLRVGAIYVPLNPSYTSSEVQFFIDDASPALFVHDYETTVEAKAYAQIEDLAFEARKTDPQSEVVPRAEDDIAAILYTSGTTGGSKGAMLSHGNLASNAISLHETWAFEPGDVLLHVLPIFHVHGLFVALHTAMLNASTIMFMNRFSVDSVLEYLPHATVMMGVPTHYIRLLANEEFDQEACRSMRLFTSGSAPMTEAVHEEFTARTGHRILERYGMTEAGMITSNPYDGDRVPGTVGFALPGVDLRVCDEQGKPCEPGQIGVVEMRGPNLFQGYWQLPEKTASDHRADGFFVTGDVGFLDESGRLTLEGRSGDMIISGGLNVYPREVELVIDAIPGVSESAVIAVAHPDFGEVGLAVVVPHSSDSVARSTINEALSEQLAGFKRPKSIEFVDELPRNSMGKVQKSELRQQFTEAEPKKN